MMDQMWHLDLILQLQEDMFAGLLQDIVSFEFLFFMVLVFVWDFLRELSKDRVLNT